MQMYLFKIWAANLGGGQRVDSTNFINSTFYSFNCYNNTRGNQTINFKELIIAINPAL